MKTSVFIGFVTKGWLNVDYRKTDGSVRKLKLTASPFVHGTNGIDYIGCEQDELVSVYSDEHGGIITVYPANIIASTFEPLDVKNLSLSTSTVTQQDVITAINNAPWLEPVTKQYCVSDLDCDCTTSTYFTVEEAVKAYVDVYCGGVVDDEETLNVLQVVKKVKITPNRSYGIEDVT